MKKIVIVSGSRAEFSLLKPLIKLFNSKRLVKLLFVVTGNHLSTHFDTSKKEILKEKINIDAEIEMQINSDTNVGMAKSIGLGIISFSEYFDKVRPHLVIILGDRSEIFSVAIAASTLKIPIAHIHGGEVTLGSLDEKMRHSISKLSNLHFTSTADYALRLVRMGERPNTVFNVGSLGVENIKQGKFRSKSWLAKNLSVDFEKRLFLVTYHPETQGKTSNYRNISNLLRVLAKFTEVNIIFTLTGSDPEGKIINSQIIKFCEKNKNAKFYSSLGQLNYFSIVKYCSCVIGNSSSGIIEIPALQIPVLNIGNRQKGRIIPFGVVNCSNTVKSISTKLKEILNISKKSYLNKNNPYDHENTSNKIVSIICKKMYLLESIKPFFDSDDIKKVKGTSNE